MDSTDNRIRNPSLLPRSLTGSLARAGTALGTGVAALSANAQIACGVPAPQTINSNDYNALNPCYFNGPVTIDAVGGVTLTNQASGVIINQALIQIFFGYIFNDGTVINQNEIDNNGGLKNFNHLVNEESARIYSSYVMWNQGQVDNFGEVTIETGFGAGATNFGGAIWNEHGLTTIFNDFNQDGGFHVHGPGELDVGANGSFLAGNGSTTTVDGLLSVSTDGGATFLSGSSALLNGTVTVATGAFFDLDDGAIMTATTNHVFTHHGTATVAGEVFQGGTLTIGAGGEVTLAPTGTMTLQDGSDTWIEFGGLLKLEGGSEFVALTNSAIQIFGELDADPGSNFDQLPGGSMLVATNAVATFGGDFHLGGDTSQGGTLTIESTGLVTLAPTGTLTLEDGSDTEVEFGGLLKLENGSTMFQGTNSVFEVGGQFDADSGSDFDQLPGGSMIIATNAVATFGGDFHLGGDTSQGGTLTIDSTGLVTLAPTGTITLEDGSDTEVEFGGLLKLENGSTMFQGTNSVFEVGGQFDADSGSDFDQLPGGSMIIATNAVATFGGDFHLGGDTSQGGTLTIDSTGLVTLAPTGTITLEDGSDTEVEFGGLLKLEDGSRMFQGTNSVFEVGGQFDADSGSDFDQLPGGSMLVATNAVATFGGDFHLGGDTSQGGTLTIDSTGLVTLAPTGTITLEDGSDTEVEFGGLLKLEDGSRMFQGTNSVFEIGGQFDADSSSDFDQLPGGSMIIATNAVATFGGDFHLGGDTSQGGTLTIESTGLVTLAPTGTITLGDGSDSTIEDGGELHLEANSLLHATTGSVLTIAGLWEQQAGANTTIDEGAAFEVTGPGGNALLSGVTNVSGELNNHYVAFLQGTVNVQSGGSVVNNYFMSHSGTSNLAGILLNQGGSGSLLNTVQGEINILSGGEFRNLTGATNAGLISGASGSTLTNRSFLQNIFGGTVTLAASSTFLNDTNATFRNFADATFDGSATNVGTLDNRPGGVLNFGGSFHNFDEILNESIANLTGGTLDVAPAATFHGAGTFNQTGGTLVVNGLMDQSDINLVNGVAQGSGTLRAATVTVASEFELNTGNSTGTLTVDGDLLLEGTLHIELASLTDFDILDVLGGVTLGTGSEIEFDVQFTPDPGDTITFLFSTGLTGLGNLGFSATGLPPSLLFSVSENGAFDLEISFAAVPIPASLPLLAGALAGLGLVSRRRRRSGVA